MTTDKPETGCLNLFVHVCNPPSASHIPLLGVDTGGTFTDFVFYDGRLRIHKVLSTPEAPEQAVLQGVRDLGLDPAKLVLIHGSTVATNAVLEGKGVRTVYVTNRGFGDLLTLGRQARSSLYTLQCPPTSPPVPPELCLEIGGRLAADGTTQDPLTSADLIYLREQLKLLAPKAVAINLLFSFLDDRWERALAAVVPPEIFVTYSAQVLSEYREYERGMATWLNAYVSPLVTGYLQRLQQGLPGTTLSVMQSSGGTMSVDQASALAVHMLLSGPAGGLVGAQRSGQQAGYSALLSFDMGGTSTDVALLDGELRLTREGRLGTYPVAVPMVDMHTIGAGGGSVAWVDAGGLLQVGPQSAGAIPGPACYGRGGTLATVTDANLILGRLHSVNFLGGSLQLDKAAAYHVIAVVAEQLATNVATAAMGIIQLVNEHMTGALRAISLNRGVDPRNYTLLAFGGSGGLHVCALAEGLGIRRALVPIHSGVLSALGMIAAPRRRELSRTLIGPLLNQDPAQLLTTLDSLIAHGLADLQNEGLSSTEVTIDKGVDLRYQGQSYTIYLPWGELTDLVNNFHRAHQTRYGHTLNLSVELVNLRISLCGPSPIISLAPLEKTAPAEPIEWTTVADYSELVPVWQREQLASGQRLIGPGIIVETAATTWLAPHWQCLVDEVGHLHLALANW